MVDTVLFFLDVCLIYLIYHLFLVSFYDDTTIFNFFIFWINLVFMEFYNGYYLIRLFPNDNTLRFLLRWMFLFLTGFFPLWVNGPPLSVCSFAAQGPLCCLCCSWRTWYPWPGCCFSLDLQTALLKGPTGFCALLWIATALCVYVALENHSWCSIPCQSTNPNQWKRGCLMKKLRYQNHTRKNGNIWIPNRIY